MSLHPGHRQDLALDILYQPKLVNVCDDSVCQPLHSWPSEEVLSWSSHAWQRWQGSKSDVEAIWSFIGNDKVEVLNEHRNNQGLQVKLRILIPLLMTREAFHYFFKMFALKNHWASPQPSRIVMNQLKMGVCCGRVFWGEKTSWPSKMEDKIWKTQQN